MNNVDSKLTSEKAEKEKVQFGGESQRHRELRCVLQEASACLGSRLRE